MNCNPETGNDKAKVEIVTVDIGTTSFDVSSDNVVRAANFNSIQDWLLAVCAKNEPPVKLTSFKFVVFEDDIDVTVDLLGVNKRNEYKSDTSSAKNELSSNYIFISENEFKNLSKDKALDVITAQLKAYLKTEMFKNSFFSLASEIEICSKNKRENILSK